MLPQKNQLPRTKFDSYVLWTQGQRKSEVIISAHGDRPYVYNWLRSNIKPLAVPPGMTLVFYCPDGTNLKAGTISHDFIDKNLGGRPHHEIASGSPYSDIDLTKFTFGGREDENKSIQMCLSKYDVITIRKEGIFDLSLSELLEAIKGRNYTRVHCHFCMGGLTPESVISGTTPESIISGTSANAGGIEFQYRD